MIGLKENKIGFDDKFNFCSAFVKFYWGLECAPPHLKPVSENMHLSTTERLVKRDYATARGSQESPQARYNHGIQMNEHPPPSSEVTASRVTTQHFADSNGSMCLPM